MFKRRFRSRRRFQRRGLPVARVRRTWIESAVIDPCNPLHIPILPNLDGCTTTRWEQVVVNNSLLQDKFSDRARVKRILGNLQILFNPNLPGAANPDEIYARLASAFGSLFCQLLVRPIDAAGQTELPPDIWNTSSVISGYSESKAKKTWWKHWWSNDAFSTDVGISTFQGAFQTYGVKHRFIDCADNTVGLWGQGTSPGDMTIGSSLPDCLPTQPVEPLELGGDCVACGEVDLAGAGVLSANNTGTLRAPHVWNFAFDVRKTIALREDEQLVLDFQARVPQNFFTDFSFDVLGGGIKTLLQF